MTHSQTPVTPPAGDAHRDRAMRAALHSDLPPLPRVVLIALASEIDEGGVVRYRLEALAQIVGVTSEGVLRQLQVLRDGGWITPEAPNAVRLATAVLDVE